MGYADELLARDEATLRSERQHWILPFLIAGRPVGIAAVVTVVTVLLNGIVFRTGGTGFIGDVVNVVNTLLFWVGAAALLVTAGGFGWSVARWRTQACVLTTERVILVHGVVNRQWADSTLERLSDARIEVPVLGRILRFGDLTLMTASEAGNQRLRALPDPIAFKKAVMDAKAERLLALTTPHRPAVPVAVPTTTPRSPAPWPVAPVPVASVANVAAVVPTAPRTPADEVARGIAALATLRDSGAITPGEFEAKKRELLARI